MLGKMHFLTLGGLFVLLLFSTNAVPTRNEAVEYEVLESPIKCPLDTNEYKAVRLANGVTVLAIHDAKATCCMLNLLIKAGESSEPDSMHGISHLLKFLQYAATKKYPDPEQLVCFLEEHNGTNISCTKHEYLQYNLSFPQECLDEAADRLVQCVTEPLLEKSKTIHDLTEIF